MKADGTNLEGLGLGLGLAQYYLTIQNGNGMMMNTVEYLEKSTRTQYTFELIIFYSTKCVFDAGHNLHYLV